MKAMGINRYSYDISMEAMDRIPHAKCILHLTHYIQLIPKKDISEYLKIHHLAIIFGLFMLVKAAINTPFGSDNFAYRINSRLQYSYRKQHVKTNKDELENLYI